MSSSDDPTTISLVNTQPILERITLGLYKSHFGFARKTASTSAASAVRKRAPRFPGFSIPSATKINGFLVFSFKWLRVLFFHFAMAIIPSVDLR